MFSVYGFKHIKLNKLLHNYSLDQNYNFNMFKYTEI